MSWREFEKKHHPARSLSAEQLDHIKHQFINNGLGDEAGQAAKVGHPNA
jgi:hypothetical protein